MVRCFAVNVANKRLTHAVGASRFDAAARCRFGLGVGLDQCSYSTLGPVNTWVGVRLTVLGRVNHLDAERSTLVYSA